MIVSQTLRKAQFENRLNLKTAEASFVGKIVEGTNCSPFEASIIADTAKQAFALGQWSEGHILQDGQIIFHAVSDEAPAGVPLSRCPKVRLVLTLLHREEDLEVLRRHGAGAQRRQQILRLATQAREQRGLLTQEDLALILGCDVRTIRSDIKRLREQDITVPTRGTVQDIGPGVTHKHRAIELWLAGKESTEVALALHHSLHAIERYIQTFCRVVYAQRKLRDTLQTAMVVGISVPAAHTYWDLHCELIDRDTFYQERLEDILHLGQTHWDAADGQKKRSPRPRPSSGGSRA